MFESEVYLVLPKKAAELKRGVATVLEPEPPKPVKSETEIRREAKSLAGTPPASRTIRIGGDIPIELWNRLGTRLLPKLKWQSHSDLGWPLKRKLTVRTLTG
jgi:hypothetical protein